MSETVRKFYDEHAEREWERLVRDGYHRLEFIVTTRFLEKYLPKKGTILDAGGGPGRYSIRLAKKGYNVVLLDISSSCLELGKKKAREARVSNKITFTQGTITDISESTDARFDSTICLGALSHLVEEEDREKAVAELARVTKKKAPIFISVISKYGVFRTVLQRLPWELVDPSHSKMFSEGVHRASWPGHKGANGFTDAHFFHPLELKRLLESHGVTTLEMATCEGLSSHLQAETNGIYQNKKKWRKWVALVLETCNDSCILGMGEHFMYIGRKH